MKVLMSIKPQFADKIFAGIKRYEFRRAVFKRDDIDKVIVYASAPISKVVGEFEIESILSDSVENLWDKTKDHAGIEKSFYLDYFKGKDTAYAIKIKNSTRYDKSFPLAVYGVKPPQSFMYLDI